MESDKLAEIYAMKEIYSDNIGTLAIFTPKTEKIAGNNYQPLIKGITALFNKEIYKIIVDMTNVKSIGDSVENMFYDIVKKSSDNYGRIVFAQVNRGVPIDNNVVEVYPTLDKAIESYIPNESK